MVPLRIVERIFDAADIQRWNDYVRPMDLTELDKQAHKAMIAFLLARFEEDTGRTVDWTELIEGFLFQFFPRVVLTDIKAPFFHRLMRSHADAVNGYVLRELMPSLQEWNTGFAERFKEHISRDTACSLEQQILHAAHWLATQWEFKIIRHANPPLYGIETTEQEIDARLQEFIGLAGVQKITVDRTTYGLVDLLGQLRFQQRWAQTPRLPRTAVLGHSLFVAVMAYFVSIEIDACERRKRNNFHGALFHDLPELFTRDIITPVKRSVRELERFIEEEEKVLLRESLLPLLPDSWRSEILYFVEDPFTNKIMLEGKIVNPDFREIDEKYNRDEYEPLDGELVRRCDELGAFVEACKSIENGVHPPQLVQAARSMYKRHRKRRTGQVAWGDYFEAFARLPGVSLGKQGVDATP